MPAYYLLIRDYPEKRFVSVWLRQQLGAAHVTLLYGDVPPEAALALAGALGLPVQRQSLPLPGATPAEEPT